VRLLFHYSTRVSQVQVVPLLCTPKRLLAELWKMRSLILRACTDQVVHCPCLTCLADTNSWLVCFVKVRCNVLCILFNLKKIHIAFKMQIIYVEYALAQWSVTQRYWFCTFRREYPGFGSDFFFLAGKSERIDRAYRWYKEKDYWQWWLAVSWFVIQFLWWNLVRLYS